MIAKDDERPETADLDLGGNIATLIITISPDKTSLWFVTQLKAGVSPSSGPRGPRTQR